MSPPRARWAHVLPQSVPVEVSTDNAAIRKGCWSVVAAVSWNAVSRKAAVQPYLPTALGERASQEDVNKRKRAQGGGEGILVASLRLSDQLPATSALLACRGKGPN